MDTRKTNRNSKPGNDAGRGNGLNEDTDLENPDFEPETGESIPENEIPSIARDPAFDESLRSWLAEVDAENSPCVLTLYKFDHPVTGKEYSQINEYSITNGALPTAHDIGMQYGSGRYTARLYVPRAGNKGLQRVKYFRIGPNYDIMRRQAAQSGVPLQGQGGAVPQQIVHQGPDPFTMIERVIQLITPLLARNNAPVSPGAEMVSNYTALNQILKNQTMENMNLITDIQRRLLNTPNPEDEGEDDMDETTPSKNPPTILEQIMPYIAKFLPAIIGKGPVAAATAATVQSLPQFKQVANDPSQLKTLVEYLDKTQGKEKTDKALARFKIKRPA